ncbi:homing endonuclease associated repeat-containing protein [Planctomicrobium piriforme]|uniref:Uncharacterized protein n=1 Tax=Planctomicrobium piriforme TaxID=1576369 RepID=A0A1I3TE46_9PLAN|nr:hypothetical protein [Planctomicrobium piriforme]SFJ69438.1 hypothetical protein SAMN05421753_1301 [Planctomicrobium piriforme]
MRRPTVTSRSEMLAVATSLAAEYGESLTLTAFRRETGYSQWEIFDLFGSWKQLRIAVGLTPMAPRVRNRVNEQHILDLGRQLVEELGEALTERTFQKRTGLSGRLIADRFGSWGELRQQLGLTPRAKIQKTYTEAEMIEDLYRVYRITRRKPRYHQHRHYGGRISPNTIQQYFGSWRYACECLKARLIKEEEAEYQTRLAQYQEKMKQTQLPPPLTPQ